MEPIDSTASTSKLDIATAAPPGADADMAPLVQDPGGVTPPVRPPSARKPSRWAAREFSQAALDGPEPTEMLTQVDAMAAAGHRGAAVAVLENALQGRIGKSPTIQLRLLDLYRELQQAQNHERVSAELEALYNVCVPPLDEGAEGHGLVEQGLHLPTRERLALALVRPSTTEPLDLTAFRKAVALYARLEPTGDGNVTPAPNHKGSSTLASADQNRPIQSEVAVEPPALNWTMQALPN